MILFPYWSVQITWFVSQMKNRYPNISNELSSLELGAQQGLQNPAASEVLRISL